MLIRFKENVKLRDSELYDRFDYDKLHRLTTERIVQSVGTYLLRDTVTVDILVNNTLIIVYTNLLLHSGRSDAAFDMTTALLLNMYKHVDVITSRGIADENSSDTTD